MSIILLRIVAPVTLTMAKVVSSHEYPVYSATKLPKIKSPMSKPKISYAKPLYYISLVTALSCPINMDKYCARSGLGHKVYSCVMIVFIIAINGWCMKGRLRSTYTFLVQTVVITDMIQLAILLIHNIYSIGNILCCGQKLIQNYFDMLKQFDMRLLTTINLTRKRIIFTTELIFSHFLLILLCVYDYWTWTQSLGMEVWQFYAFRLYSYYLTLVITLQIHTFANALKLRYQILNERLFDVSLDWIGNVQSQEAITVRDLFLSYKKSSAKVEMSGISLHCIIKMHDLLCDVMELLNDAFGLNTVLLVCSIIINTVIAFNLTLIFGTGVQPTTDTSYVHLITLNIFWAIFYMTMGVAIARACNRASKEAWRSATICYKLLACIPIRSTIPRERESRIMLKQLANQIEHRKPGFDACGFFPINHSMLYAIIGAVSSYIVIIIQFNNSPIISKAFAKNATLP